MPLSLIEAPAGLPVDLEAARAWLRLDTTDEDALLGRLLAAATRRVEFECALAMIDQRWRYLRDCWPREAVLKLPIHPVRAVESVKVLTDAGLIDVDPALWRASLDARPARLRAMPGFPRPAAGIDVVQVELRAGFGAAPADVPADLRQAVLMLAAHWFEAREGATADGWRGMPAEVRELLAPWRPLAM